MEETTNNPNPDPLLPLVVKKGSNKSLLSNPSAIPGPSSVMDRTANSLSFVTIERFCNSALHSASAFFSLILTLPGRVWISLEGVCQQVVQDHLQVLLVEAFNQDAGSDVTLDFDALRRQDRDFGNGVLENL